MTDVLVSAASRPNAWQNVGQGVGEDLRGYVRELVRERGVEREDERLHDCLRAGVAPFSSHDPRASMP